MQEIRFGVLGAAGFAAKRPIPALAAAENCRLQAIHGLPAERDALEAIAEKHAAAKVYTTAEELVGDPQVDAVYVATPVHLHHEHTVLAAGARKHVLVEKPMALTVQQCRKMLSACRRGKVKLQVGYMRRFHPYHAKIKEIIDRGTLGEIVEIRVQTHLWYPPAQGAWRQDPCQGGGGAFIDMGSHCLELMEYFLGEIVWVQGFTDNVAFDYGVEDLSIAIVKFRCRATGIIDASFAIPHRQNVVEVYGTKGTLAAKRTAGPFADPELVLLDDNGRTTVAVAGTMDQYQAEFEHFARAIREGVEPEVDGKAGLRNLKQILAVYESARRKRPVRVAT